jgi:radical SAM superfamily enzyme YgiQ (UPF0313 family)
MARRPRLLLINPAHGTSFWGMEHAADQAGARYTLPPLGLATIAALTPGDWDIDLVDENVGPVDLDAPCDIVGITAMNVQAARAFALADAFRRRGRTVVFGGPYATLQPERVAPHADILVVGEAEYTWPQFCADWTKGEPKRRYEETGTVALSDSPVPRFDLLECEAYSSLSMQTTRGCPFSCEFCDIIVMQGRRVRSKSTEQVLREMDAARSVGARGVFFADDNFIGNQKHARQVLDGLIAHRRRTEYRPILFTQASVNMADKPWLLEKMVAAGFTRVFVGVESPRQSSLREAGKQQNTHGDLVERVHTIQRAGLMVWAGMIVGFDHDDAEIFREQAEFLDAAGISVAMVGMLNAPPRTPLYARLEADGRLDPGTDWADNCAWTNIIPQGMSRAALFEGYADLVQHLYEPQRYADRVLANVARMKPCQGPKATPGASELMDLGRASSAFGNTPARRRFFFPNLLRALRANPTHFTEAAIHLGIYRHFERYVPHLVGSLRTSVEVERVRVRERVWGAAQPPAQPGLVQVSG